MTRAVPEYTKLAIRPLFDRLLQSYQDQVLPNSKNRLGIADFQWALHPGGEAILDGAKETLGLAEEQLQASREVYRTRGNSSSLTVLAVLDRVRKDQSDKTHILATSFGPGLAIEMAMLRRCGR